MLIKSQVIADGSGSIAGLTISRNRGGIYLRARVVPVNPATAAQTAVRTALATLAARWSSTITSVQRDGWDLYALNVPLPGPLGDPRNVGGLGMYIRTNIATSLLGLVPEDTAPAIFNLGTFTPFTLPTAVSGTTTVGFAFDNTDEWANEDDAYLAVFAARPVSPAVNYFTGPYQFAGFIAGDALIAPTSPAAIVSPFPFLAAQKIHFRGVILRADGRYSTAQRMAAIAT